LHDQRSCILQVTGFAVLVLLAACVRPREEPRVTIEASAPPSPSPSPPAPVAPVREPVEARPALPDVATDWCESSLGWRGLDEGTCYFLPEGAKRLLIYLSGIVPPTPKSTQKENVQRVVMSAAKRAGVAVLLPRGRRGIGPTDARDWWAWPTGPADYDTHATKLVAEWAAARAKLEAALGPFERVYLAGSSSGAYFLTTLAFRGAVDMDGYAAASGGAVGSGLEPGVNKRPFYVGYATGDPTNGGPKALGAYLKSAGWPVRVAEHPGGHGAREVYLDEAFDLFGR
jgi:predicted esterase